GGGAAAAPAAAPAANSGLSENAACGLAYITIIPAIIFLVMAPYNQNPKIKFHCFQELGLAVCWLVAWFLVVIPFLGWVLSPLIGLTLFVCWIICVIKAFNGGMFKLPLIGDFAAKQAGLTQ